MQLEKIKCKPLERAKDIHISESYIVGCTGQKAAILDKQLNLLHTVEGLEYVYSAEVSPDETKLLLISNGNKFYIVDMQTFEKSRVTVRAPYNYNLEGKGCWSFDGKSVWISVQRQTCYINSTLRRYPLEDFSKYEDYLADQYVLNNILRLDHYGTYLLTGYNRKENHKNYLIYFDGTTFREFPLETTGAMLAPTVTADMEKGIVTVASFTGCKQFTLDGMATETISHPDPHDRKLRASDLLHALFEGDVQAQNEMKALSESLGLENIPAPDSINKYEKSSCGKYIYLASQSGFYLLDADTAELLGSVPVEYGVQNVVELAPGMIGLATWSGVKVYRLLDVS